MDRRSFLGTLLAVVVAPSTVIADSRRRRHRRRHSRTDQRHDSVSLILIRCADEAYYATKFGSWECVKGKHGKVGHTVTASGLPKHYHYALEHRSWVFYYADINAYLAAKRGVEDFRRRRRKDQ